VGSLVGVYIYWHFHDLIYREKQESVGMARGILIWSELSIPLFILVLVLILVLMVVFLSRVERVAIEIAFATVDQSDIRGSKPHNRDPSGAASH
jgi:lipopolysaccharide export LptBFGC system permease protein LptF